ncbi:MobA protein [Burkholderia sp. Ac-20379]|uniref:MobA protein n=1 Tax=Burkholderia sp. Ac-20379 TaxID=2703900 RepID=UPI00197D3C8E|nr:MobA protein [Burkholderia sp. Ac-20379]MBN3725746.1 MobA protein [Burkholderia sp. Ac-20379]
MTADFSALFADPAPWGGLRGDDYFWPAMRDAVRGEPLPDSLAALDARIAALYEHWTGQPLSSNERIFIAEFAHGGMSSGRVHPPFWNDIALPLLRARWVELTGRTT